MFDPESKKNNYDVLQATRRLHEHIIPRLAEEIDQMLNNNLDPLEINLSYEFHRRGGTDHSPIVGELW